MSLNNTTQCIVSFLQIIYHRKNIVSSFQTHTDIQRKYISSKKKINFCRIKPRTSYTILSTFLIKVCCFRYVHNSLFGNWILCHQLHYIAVALRSKILFSCWSLHQYYITDFMTSHKFLLSNENPSRISWTFKKETCVENNTEWQSRRNKIFLHIFLSSSAVFLNIYTHNSPSAHTKYVPICIIKALAAWDFKSTNDTFRVY